MEKIDFQSVDNVSLTGFIYKCENDTKSVIISIHGMASNCLKKRENEVAKMAIGNNIDFFAFNTRGSEIVKYIDKKGEKQLGGTAYEDVLNGYEDIVGSILEMKKLGYKKIYLVGHSLGATKIVYTYNRLKEEQSPVLEEIKGICLLSLIDLPKAFKVYMRENVNKYMEYALEKEKQAKFYEMMPIQSFLHPICVKSFLRYLRDNHEIDFAGFGRDSELKILNNIKTPLFMRWGNVNEFILQKAEDLVNILNQQISNEFKNINYIDGADHSYTKVEEILSKEILEFILDVENM